MIPTLNEERYIGECVRSLLEQDYPADRMEILVVDGRSDDRTREIVEEISAASPNVRLVDNPRRITPAALNLAIDAARGEVITRIDAHCRYREDYVRLCVETLLETGADNVGGSLITHPGADTTLGHAIVHVQTSRFGMGGAQFRLAEARGGWVDTVPFGTYRRDIFDRVGRFDEDLLRNQDNEFNSRILASGGKIYLNPEIRLHYYSRPTLRGFLRMLSKNALYHWLVLRKTPGAFRLRHMAPALFVAVLILSAAGGLLWPLIWWMGGAVLGLYLLADLAASVQIARREGLRFLAVMPWVFLLCHLRYGLSTWAGFWRFMIFGRTGRSAAGEKAGR
jgi:glycosyltransferase involved in cell wall biosynthesis